MNIDTTHTTLESKIDTIVKLYGGINEEPIFPRERVWFRGKRTSAELTHRNCYHKTERSGEHKPSRGAVHLWTAALDVTTRLTFQLVTASRLRDDHTTSRISNTRRSYK